MTHDQIQKAARAVFALHTMRGDKTRPRLPVYSGGPRRKRGRPAKVKACPC